MATGTAAGSTVQNVGNTTVNDMVTVIDGNIFTTSLIVAKVFEKNHKDVLKAIDNLECSSEFRERNFALTSIDIPQPNGGIRKERAYNLTRDGFSFLAMGFTGAKAAAWKETFLEAFNQMEKALESRAAILSSASSTPFSGEPLSESSLLSLRGIIAYWAYMDALPLSLAESYLCGFFQVRRLRELPQAHWEDAWRIAWDNAHRVSRQGAPASEDHRSIIEAMLCACRQFTSVTDVDFATLVADCGEMEALADFSAQDVPKVVACLWGILNQVLQYAQCRQIGHAE